MRRKKFLAFMLAVSVTAIQAHCLNAAVYAEEMTIANLDTQVVSDSDAPSVSDPDAPSVSDPEDHSR